MENDPKYLIKDYKYWSVQAHSNQGYLGRSVIWCKRVNALDLADATEDEQKELFMILKQLREATKWAFNPDWFNYAFLGNETRHLHCHLVPRYQTPRQFEGVTFTDKDWGHNYRTDKNFATPPQVLEAIRLKLMQEFNQ